LVVRGLIARDVGRRLVLTKQGLLCDVQNRRCSILFHFDVPGG
jgi:hypothetical protein